MLVSGARVTRVTGSGALPHDVAEQLDGVAGVRAAGRLRPVEVAEAVLAVDVAGVADVLQQRAGAARGDRDVVDGRPRRAR